MKIKQLNELKLNSLKELNDKVEDLEKDIIKTRIEQNYGKVKNVHSAKNKRKDIAQIKTIIKMKQLAQINSNVEKQDTGARP